MHYFMLNYIVWSIFFNENVVFALNIYFFVFLLFYIHKSAILLTASFKDYFVQFTFITVSVLTPYNPLAILMTQAYWPRLQNLPAACMTKSKDITAISVLCMRECVKYVNEYTFQIFTASTFIKTFLEEIIHKYALGMIIDSRTLK